MPVVTDDSGFRVESNAESEAQLKALLAADKPKPKKAPKQAPLPAPIPEPEPEPEPVPVPAESPAAPEDEPLESEIEDSSKPGKTADQPRDESGKFVGEEKRKKPRDDPFARMKQATDRAAELARQVAALEARLAAKEAPQAQAVPAPPVSDQSIPGMRAKPQESDVGSKYATYADFVEDLSDWKAERRVLTTLAMRDQAAAQQEAQRLERAQWDANAKRVQDARQKYPDWDTVLETVDQAFRSAGLVDAKGIGLLPPAMYQAVLSSEQSADILYGLGTHAEDAVALAREVATAPAESAPVLRRYLESKYAPDAANGTGPALAPVSHAKAPIKPVGSSPIAAGPRADDAELDLVDFVKAGNEAERLRRRLRRGM